MKLLLMALLMAAAPPWLANVAANAGGEGDPDGCVIVVADHDGADTQAHARVVGEGTGATATVMVTASGGEDEGGKSKRIVVRALGGGEERAWLGVSIGEVSDVLDAQLDLDGRGVIIQNVVEGSAADKGGLEPHDVVLSIDGKAVEGGAAQAARLIGEHKPGDEVDIVVLRNGREKELTVTLGSSADMTGAAFAWKFKTGDPDLDVEEHVETIGKMLRKDDEGNWVLEDLGDLSKLKDLSGQLQSIIPRSGTRSIQVFAEDGKKRIQIKVERDGTVLNVRQDGDGEITVSRVDPNGESTEKVYANEDELREADEEAYDLLKEVNQSVVVHLDIDGLDEALDDLDLKFDFDTGEWADRFSEWQQQLEQSLSEAREAHKRAMEEFQDLMKQWREGGGLPDDFDLGKLPALLHRRGLSDLPGLMKLRRFDKPRHTFEVQEDGTIEVRIRKGDSELVQRFSDEDDLARRNPDLYEKYDRLMSGDDEE